MLYYVQYYIITEKFNPVKYQMSNDICINIWQQVNKLSITDMIEDYQFKNNTSGYKPCFIFIKYENDQEKKILESIFKDDLTNINQFNVCTSIRTIIDNIHIIKCY